MEFQDGEAAVLTAGINVAIEKSTARTNCGNVLWARGLMLAALLGTGLDRLSGVWVAADCVAASRPSRRSRSVTDPYHPELQ